MTQDRRRGKENKCRAQRGHQPQTGRGKAGENGGAENGALLAARGPVTHASITTPQHRTTTLYPHSHPHIPTQDLKIIDTPTNSVWGRQVDGNEGRENGSCCSLGGGREGAMFTFPVKHTLTSPVAGPDSPHTCLPWVP